MYKLKQEFIELIESNRELRLKIALNLEIQEKTIDMSITRGSDNLTKYGSLLAIKEHTGKNFEDLIEKINETIAA
jgi:hypothetical protein